MKILSVIAKIVAALAFVAGAVYLLATYGDKVVAWCKKILNCPFCQGEVVEVEIPDGEEIAEEITEEVTEEAPAEDAPVAEEKDFEG